MVGKNSSVGFVIPKQEASDLSISLIVRITNTWGSHSKKWGNTVLRRRKNEIPINERKFWEKISGSLHFDLNLKD